jgi:isochorismate synthase
MQTIETAVLSKESILCYLNDIIVYCQEQGYGLALWRLPNAAQVNLLISYQPQEITSHDIETLPSGFLLGRFDAATAQQKTFLKADICLTFTEQTQAEALVELKEKLPAISLGKQRDTAPVPSKLRVGLNAEARLAFEDLVDKAIAHIKDGEMKKVVLARKQHFALDGAIYFGKLWQSLCKRYHNTFNSLVFTPKHGLWLGATPEVLVSQDAQMMFRTMALAGTQRAGEKSEKEAVWSQKEIEEQAYVRRYIIDCLKQIRLREFEDIGPKTMRVGHLFHLRTDFLVNLHDAHFPNLLSTMLQLLHPTSAVCGTPKQEAFDFIAQHEQIDRALYGGFIGPVNVQSETHLFVNLRCAKFEPKQVHLFAGAGITEDSVPEKEFQETEAKMEVMLSIIND